MHTVSTLALGGGYPLLRTLDSAVVRMNLPGHYVLLEHEKLKVQVTIDYRRVRDAIYTSVFTRVALLSVSDSVKVEIKLTESDLLVFTVVGLDGSEATVNVRGEGTSS